MMKSATIARSERRLIFGLGATGQSVARWWRQQGVAFAALDTRAERADDEAAVADIDRDKAAFGDIDAAFVDHCTEMIAPLSSLGVDPGNV